MKRTLIILAAVLATRAGWAGVGATQSEFLKIGLSPRAAGMAGAFGAVADDLGALEYNPAGLGLINNSQVTAMGVQWIADIRFAALAGAHVVPYLGTIALGLSAMDSGGGVLGVEDVAGSLANFQATNMLVRAGWARTLMDNLTVGVAAKVAQERIAEFSSTGATFDFGAIYIPTHGFSLGLALMNLGVASAFEERNDALPARIKIAGALKALEGDFGQVVTALDIDYYPHPQNVARPAIGVEYWGGKYLALRAGYALKKTDLSEEVGFAAGIGVRFKQFRFDLAYQPFAGLGQAFRASLNWEIWPLVSLTIPGAAVGEFRSLPAGRVQIAAPPYVTAEAGEGSVLLKWEAPQVSSLSGYNVYYRKEGTGRFHKFNEEPMVTTTAIIGGLESNVRYTFVVHAVDDANPPRESVPSPQADAIPY